MYNKTCRRVVASNCSRKKEGRDDGTRRHLLKDISNHLLYSLLQWRGVSKKAERAFETSAIPAMTFVKPSSPTPPRVHLATAMGICTRFTSCMQLVARREGANQIFGAHCSLYGSCSRNVALRNAIGDKGMCWPLSPSDVLKTKIWHCPPPHQIVSRDQ